jgi:RimJ/RimL family protein N-acetyltransferase
MVADTVPASPVSASGLTTLRLRLVPLSLADAHALMHGRRPPRAYWAPDYPTDASLVAAGMLVAAEAEGHDLGPWTAYQVIRRADGLVIGGCGFVLGGPDERGRVHLGCSIVDSVGDARHRYGAEAVTAMIAWARSWPGVTRVITETSACNTAALARYEGAGMRRARIDDDRFVVLEA